MIKCTYFLESVDIKLYNMRLFGVLYQYSLVVLVPTYQSLENKKNKKQYMSLFQRQKYSYCLRKVSLTIFSSLHPIYQFLIKGNSLLHSWNINSNVSFLKSHYFMQFHSSTLCKTVLLSIFYSWNACIVSLYQKA